MAGIAQKPIGTPKPHDDYYLAWILKIAAAATVEISETTQAVYLERLRQLTANEIKVAGTRTISEWSEASKMPPLAFILERTASEPELHEYAIPATWKETARVRLGLQRQEIEEWLEAGKDAQREHMAKLHEDPEWRAMAERLGAFPGLNRKSEPSEWERLDPAELSGWAHRKAQEGGWIR